MVKSVQIINELFRTIELFGVDKTLSILKDSQKSKNDFSELDIDYILDAVSEISNVDKQRILFGNDRTDERKIALCLSIYFVRENFDYSYSDMGKIFNKDSSAINRYYTSVKNVVKLPKTEFEKKLEEYRKKINYLINERNLKKQHGTKSNH
jgi:chromosomal replication initiation ATPase DnaA